MRIEDALKNPERRAQSERLKAIRARGYRGPNAVSSLPLERPAVEHKAAPLLPPALPKMAKAVERGVWYGPPPPVSGERPTISDIISAMVSITGLSRSILLSSQRTRVVVYPRQVAMAAAVQWAGLSLSRVGQFFGGRDRTTVLHAVRVVEERRAEGHEATCELITALEKWFGREWVPDTRRGKRSVGKLTLDPWTSKRLADLERLWAGGERQRDIATALGGAITQDAVCNKLRDLRNAKPDAMRVIDRRRHQVQRAALEGLS